MTTTVSIATETAPFRLQGLDQNHSVLYLGTFPRCCFPPKLVIWYYPNLVALFAQAKWLNDRQLPTLEQQVLTDFISEGYLESHIRKMRSRYDRCRQVLVQELTAVWLVLPFWGEGRHSFDGAPAYSI